MEAAEKRKKEIEQQKRVASVHEEDEELKLDLQEIPSQPTGTTEIQESQKTDPVVNPDMTDTAANSLDKGVNEDVAVPMVTSTSVTDSQQATVMPTAAAAAAVNGMLMFFFFIGWGHCTMLNYCILIHLVYYHIQESFNK